MESLLLPCLITADSILEDFIDEDSWYSFDLLNISSPFLNCPADTWNVTYSYTAATEKS